jgi:hypothetical protein
MSRRILTIVAVVATTAAVPAHAELVGSWTASVSEKHPGRLAFSLTTSHDGQHGMPYERSAFDGLTTAQVESPSRVSVQFTLERDAGTVSFDGIFRDGRGAGEFTFVPNPEYANRLRSLGLQLDRKHTSDDREMLNLTLCDVSIEFIRSMQAIGYDESLDKYVAFRIFDVNPAYVREMAKAGFDHLSAEKLTETRIHGATPEYIRTMRANGEDLTLDQYIESRIFQVTPEFAAEIAKAGYPDLERDVLVQFRIHGVTPEFIAELRDVGYTRLPAQKLVEMRIHGVTPEFIRRVEKAGYRKVPVDKLVQMRIFDIDPEMVRALDDSDRKGASGR